MANNLIIANSMETSFNKVNDALLSLSQVADNSVFEKFKNPKSTLLVDLRLQVEENHQITQSKMKLN